MIEYQTLSVAVDAFDPVHPSGKPKTKLFRAKSAHGQKLRSITRDGPLVTVTCVKSGRTVEIPFSQCAGGLNWPPGGAPVKADETEADVSEPEVPETKPAGKRGGKKAAE